LGPAEGRRGRETDRASALCGAECYGVGKSEERF
jgi:hypothetical protein